MTSAAAAHRIIQRLLLDRGWPAAGVCATARAALALVEDLCREDVVDVLAREPIGVTSHVLLERGPGSSQAGRSSSDPLGLAGGVSGVPGQPGTAGKPNSSSR